MQRNNQFGLGRPIPESVKREVRQRCGFGCVVCGSPFIQYHHADVAFADARFHDPAKITILCATCHDRATRGTYSDEKIREHMQRPYCLEHGPAFTDVDYGATAPRVRFAGSEFEECAIPVRVADYAIVMMERPPEAEAPVLISAFFSNTRGEVSLVIQRNNVLLRPTNWDITTEGTRIRIWDAARQPSLVLILIPRQHIEVERIESKFLGWAFSGDASELRFTPPGAPGPTTVSGMLMFGGRVGFQFDQPRLN